MDRRSLMLLVAVFILSLAADCARVSEQAAGPKSTGQNVAYKPTRPPRLYTAVKTVNYRMTVFNSVSVYANKAVSPLQALEAAGISYSVRDMQGMPFVEAVGGVKGSWIFAVDDNLPPNSWIRRLGATTITTTDQVQQLLPKFQRGTLGISVAASDPSAPASAVTAATVFALRPYQKGMRITWFNVGPWQPDK